MKVILMVAAMSEKIELIGSIIPFIYFYYIFVLVFVFNLTVNTYDGWRAVAAG